MKRRSSVLRGLLLIGTIVFSQQIATAQQPAPVPFGIGQGQGQGNPGGNQGLVGGIGSDGGAAAADFDSLIDLITSTVEADSWMENGTGEGEVQPFPNGVYADAVGTLRFAKTSADASADLMEVVPKAPVEDGDAHDVRQSSALRYVSLPKLEAAIRARQLARQPLDEAMLTLAGMQRVHHVYVVPPTADRAGDLILAGPAGDWRVNADGKIISTQFGQPVVRLDDLIVLWRRHLVRGGKAFGVSIEPRRENLAKVQDFVAQTSARPLEPSERGDWIDGLRASLGKQDVAFFGIEPDSHVARVLLVADYHMKLIGMGIADGVDGVVGYLRSVKVGRDGSVPPMTVLRWWFAMDYEPVQANADRSAFVLQGQGAKVLSENQLLAARGQRVRTGQSEDLNKQYADSFTNHFAEICEKYPVYTELRNVFDLSMVLALIDREELVSRVGWQPTLFANADWLPLPKMRVPAEVETVVNHRVVRRKHIIAGISGGVWIDAKRTLAVESAEGELANSNATPNAPTDESVWWWD